MLNRKKPFFVGAILLLIVAVFVYKELGSKKNISQSQQSESSQPGVVPIQDKKSLNDFIAQNPTSSLRAMLIGSWQRTGIKDQTVTYKDDQTAEVYSDGILQDSFGWQLEPSKTDPPNFSIVEKGSPDRFYTILNLDSHNLKLKYAVTNAVLDYTKK